MLATNYCTISIKKQSCCCDSVIADRTAYNVRCSYTDHCLKWPWSAWIFTNWSLHCFLSAFRRLC